MKKILKTAVVAAVVCISAIAMSICAFAEDFEISTTRAKMCPAWGQSITYTSDEMKLAYFTEDTEILIEYETADGAMPDNGYNPVELIFQNYNVEPQIWCQISPVEFDETSARFVYEDMVTQYTGWNGAADFSDVNNICFGGTMVGAKVTKVTVINCEVPEVTTTTTAATTTEQITEAVTEAETTAATTKAEEKPAEKNGGIPIVLIVVITVVVAVAIVVTIIILKTRKRFY